MTMPMKTIEDARGRCTACGRTIKFVADGSGIQIGANVDIDQIDSECAADISRLWLAREGRVSILAEFRSDPVKYLTERGFLDGKGRVRADHLSEFTGRMADGTKPGMVSVAAEEAAAEAARESIRRSRRTAAAVE